MSTLRPLAYLTLIAMSACGGRTSLLLDLDEGPDGGAPGTPAPSPWAGADGGTAPTTEPGVPSGGGGNTTTPSTPGTSPGGDPTSPTTPAGVSCGTVTCAAAQECCIRPEGGKLSETCVSSGSCTNGLSLACTGPSNCASGQVCCAASAGGGSIKATCATTCGGGGGGGGGGLSVRLCESDTDCQSGYRCRSFPGTDLKACVRDRTASGGGGGGGGGPGGGG